jgi:PAS domain S-box-containing protein
MKTRGSEVEQLRLLTTAMEQCEESVLITTAQLDLPGPEIIYINPAFTRMTGYSFDEVVGKTPRILQGPKTDGSIISQLRKDCEEGKLSHGEIINYRKDGSEFNIEWDIGPVRNERGEITHFVATLRDITARVDEKLFKSEKEFRSLFELSAVGMARVSPEGRYLRVNRKLCDMLGYTEEELLQLTLHQVTHPDDRVFSAAQLSASYTGEDEYAIEKRYMRKDGSIIWVLINWRVVRDAGGKPLRSVANVQDITARKLAEEALRKSQEALQESQERLHLAMEAGEIGTFDWNVRTNEIIWTEPSKATFGRPKQASRGAYAESRERIHPEDLLACDASFEEACRNKRPHWKGEYRMKDGQADGHRWIHSRSHIFYDAQGEPLRVIGVNLDITERKKAEAEREELLARERAARSEAEHSAESVRRLQRVTDSALGCVAIEDLLPKMLGPVRDLLETDSAAILLLAEDEKTLVVRAVVGLGQEGMGFRLPIGEGIGGSIAARHDPLAIEDVSAWKVLHPGLRETVRSLIGAPLIAKGRLIGAIHAGTIQTRHFTESDLRLMQLAADRLALAIEQIRLYEVEQQARRQAEESNRMKDEFLALVSHELRSPLNAMLGYARLLRFGPLDSQKVKKSVEVIERGAKTQTQIIDDLLDTARIISGKLRIDVGPADLVAVIESALQTIHPAADAKNITIETNLDPKAGRIIGDPDRLQQVVWNLLSNAVKFTPPGGRVEARLERIDPHVCITVSDTGKGISPDFLPYVFDRFRQADASSSRRYGGLGLGLALVKYLVELHGGTIEGSSKGEGTGATFKILLPVPAVSRSLHETESSVAAAAGPENAPLSGIRALVVDDEDDARELVKTVIAHYGANVVAARSAAEAFALITAIPEQKRFDVIVTDLSMPDEDGYNLLRRLRAWEHEHDLYTPAVALTAYARSEDRKRALMTGFQMHVTKPAEPDELAVVLASVVNRPNTAS